MLRIARAAEREPAAAGVNVTLMLQLLPAASVDPQVFICPKSAVFAPVSPIPVIARSADPVLDKVMVVLLEVLTS